MSALHPIAGERRWVVVTRRKGAMASFSQPTTRELAEELAALPTYPDAAVAVYKLVCVSPQPGEPQ